MYSTAIRRSTAAPTKWRQSDGRQVSMCEALKTVRSRGRDRHMRETVIFLVIAFLAGRGGAAADPVTLSGNGVLSFVSESEVQLYLGFTPAVGDPFTFAFSVQPAGGDLQPGPGGFYSLGTGNFASTLGAGSFARESLCLALFVTTTSLGLTGCFFLVGLCHVVS